MKTAYGKLTALILILAAALLFLSPMRSGLEDHLYAYPRALRMNSGKGGCPGLRHRCRHG